MKTTLLALALVSLALGVVALAAPASATCYVEYHTLDPIRRDTGTVLDAVSVRYGVYRCEPPPPE